MGGAAAHCGDSVPGVSVQMYWQWAEYYASKIRNVLVARDLAGSLRWPLPMGLLLVLVGVVLMDLWNARRSTSVAIESGKA